MRTDTEKRILLIEPSPIVREGFRKILEELNGFTLVACYADTSQLLERCTNHRADILIFNPILMSYQQRTNIRNFFELPSSVQLIALIYSLVDELLLQQFAATININDDMSRISKKLQTSSKDNVTTKTESEDLSDRENEILIAVVKGLTNKEIAEKHFISVHTVISHRKNIIRKTGIKSVSGLTVYALLNNLIKYEDVE